VATHYQTLGVAPNASAAALRSAYVAKARELHPDRQVGRTTDEVQRAQRAMQDVNAAWAVLGDPRARRSYDDALPPATETVSAPRPVSPSGRPAVVLDEIDDDRSSPLPFLVRAAPVVLLLGVLVTIFVVTAFAAGSRSVDPRQYVDVDDGTPEVGACVDVRSSGVVSVACDAAGALRVERVVDRADDCAPGEVPVWWAEDRQLCVRPPS
jgi:hypothetical protein